MKKSKKAAVLATALCALLLLGWATRADNITYIAPTVASSTPKAVVHTPTARQEVWISALEWCESRGVVTAVNPKDRDNTPSYGAFQFKPSTYAFYAPLAGLASTTNYMSSTGQHAIVEYMVMSTSTDWYQQFPDCVANHIGLPPK